MIDELNIGMVSLVLYDTRENLWILNIIKTLTKAKQLHVLLPVRFKQERDTLQKVTSKIRMYIIPF